MPVGTLAGLLRILKLFHVGFGHFEIAIKNPFRIKPPPNSVANKITWHLLVLASISLS